MIGIFYINLWHSTDSNEGDMQLMHRRDWLFPYCIDLLFSALVVYKVKQIFSLPPKLYFIAWTQSRESLKLVIILNIRNFESVDWIHIINDLDFQ